MENSDWPLIWKIALTDFTEDTIRVSCVCRRLYPFCIFEITKIGLLTRPDWACGGQWNRAYQFVQLLANAFNVAHIEVIAFFDGTLKEHKKQSFERNDFRQKTISVLKHIRMIGTPPPKIWWLPPSGIRTCLRNAMRNLSIQVVSGAGMRMPIKH